ncbi:hypothetical protein MNBD_GAMMA12-1333 [hydrothermal vent metagenome]|uniref:Methyltransferase FkbM domain-containing protein n=1 Tax=hydrothermal vent metagenome TaxID=652676 RepID=A0A3B0YB11_9ZZZZ
MSAHPTNQERTESFRKKFSREKTIKYLLANVNPIIFDVGANAGQSLLEFKGWWPASTIHCFEPQHECWESLIDLQGEYAKGEVFVNKCASGNILKENALFYTHDITSGQSGFNKINEKSRDSIDLRVYEGSSKDKLHEYTSTLNHERNVKIVRLDSYMDENDIQHIELLKIDTQGHEPEVLDGLGNRLCDVDVVITELMFYDYYERSLSFTEIEKYLHPAGFHLYDISHISKNPMNGRTDWIDVIYVNERLRTRN